MKACVIMSVYKNDRFDNVKKSLESLFAQTYNNFDIFVQQDGSIEPKLFKFLDGLDKKDKIFFFKRQENRGLAYSLNEILKKIDGQYEYIFRMDADDIAMPERFERQMRFMKKHQDIDICGTYIQEFGEGIEYSKIVRYPLEHEEMFEFFKKRVPLAHVSACFRQTFFQKAGFYPETGHISNEDTLLWMKAFSHGCRFANIDYIGVQVRVSEAFFNRRRNYKKVWYDFLNRLEVNKTLGYGMESYVYALAIAGINLLPPSLKKIAYKTLR